MCLITFAYKIHPKYKLILVANRDEFFSRPTATAHWWSDHTAILGGRDLQAKGTWMAMHRNGRFAAVTNYRDITKILPNAQSRGDLPVDFLLSKESSENYAQKMYNERAKYNGFNLITLDKEMTYISNYDDKIQTLNPGIYGLSNALLDTPWPKVMQVKKDLHSFIQQPFELIDLMEMMQDKQMAADEKLPNTGLDYTREKALSAVHIYTPDYGTRCTTAIAIAYDGNIQFIEKNYPVGNRIEGIKNFEFKITSFK